MSKYGKYLTDKERRENKFITREKEFIITLPKKRKQNVIEDTVLKGYFKQQGLSKEEIEQAISSFKEQKAAQQPDMEQIQLQAVQVRQALQQAQIENKAILSAIELRLDVKTVPYLMKMADFNNVMKEDGTVNEDTIKEALNKVLEDVPALKPGTEKTTGLNENKI